MAELAPLLLTPNVMAWMNEAGLTEAGAQSILDYAKDQAQWAASEHADPHMAIMSAVATLAAMLHASSAPRAEWPRYITDMFALIEPAVKDHVHSWKPEMLQ